MAKRESLEDKVFGRLTVIRQNGVDKHFKRRWLCKCECGSTVTITGVYLKNGDTKSCGCYATYQRHNVNKKHGLSHKKNSEYEIWKGMKARCYNTNHSGYNNYGGRGIEVCDRWRSSFENFISDMGLKPSPKHSLDRYPDTNGNYCPENCRWATTEEQSRNKRNNKWYNMGDKRMIMEDWAKYFGVDQSTLYEHLQTKDFNTVYQFYSQKNKIIEKLSK